MIDSEGDFGLFQHRPIITTCSWREWRKLAKLQFGAQLHDGVRNARYSCLEHTCRIFPQFLRSQSWVPDYRRAYMPRPAGIRIVCSRDKNQETCVSSTWMVETFPPLLLRLLNSALPNNPFMRCPTNKFWIVRREYFLYIARNRIHSLANDRRKICHQWRGR